MIVQIDELKYEINEYNTNPNKLRKRRGTRLYNSVKKLIEEVGLLNPLIVHPKGVDGKYRVLVGNHRLLVLRDLGYTEVPILIKPPDMKAASLRDDTYIPTEVDEWR